MIQNNRNMRKKPHGTQEPKTSGLWRPRKKLKRELKMSKDVQQKGLCLQKGLYLQLSRCKSRWKITQRKRSLELTFVKMWRAKQEGQMWVLKQLVSFLEKKNCSVLTWKIVCAGVLIWNASDSSVLLPFTQMKNCKLHFFFFLVSTRELQVELHWSKMKIICHKFMGNPFTRATVARSKKDLTWDSTLPLPDLNFKDPRW